MIQRPGLPSWEVATPRIVLQSDVPSAGLPLRWVFQSRKMQLLAEQLAEPKKETENNTSNTQYTQKKLTITKPSILCV